MRHLPWALLLTLLGITGSVRAQESDSLAARWVMHQQVVALLNPMGAEHRMDVGVRENLSDSDELLLSGIHIEAGATTAVSPVYGIGGGYLRVSPLSFLVLRGEVVGMGVWPIGMSGAGYYGLDSYDADVRSQALGAEDGRSATGWMGTFSVTLQGALELGDGVRLLLASELGVTRGELGSSPFYYSMTHDLVLARQDTLITSSSFVGVEVHAASDLVVRVGAYDDLRHAPNSGYVGHQVGGIVMLEWQHIDTRLGALAVFVRGGGYTHHVLRAEQATILGGLSVDYELGGL